MTFDRLDLALKESVGNLHGDHRRVLHWYAHHVGEEHDYHDLQLQDGIPLIFPYKHICRLSKKGEYAVSVRTGGNLVYQPDDSWSLTFHHSDQNGVQRVAKCLNDSIPIGVLWQSTYQYPGSRIHKVLGLAMVVDRGERYFTFRGLPDRVGKDLFAMNASSPENETLSGGPTTSILKGNLRAVVAKVDVGPDFHKPPNYAEAVNRVTRTIAERRGQRDFRTKLLEAYQGKCAISSCDAAEALEACNILKYAETGNNQLSNGLLLRADLHTLFDLGLIAIDPETKKVLAAPDLIHSTYKEFVGRRVRLPNNPEDWPDSSSLACQINMAGL